MSRVIRRPRTAIAVLGVATILLAGPAAASAAKASAGELSALFGLATAPDGSLLVADAGQGIVAIRGGDRTLLASLPNATDVAAVGVGNVYAITGGGPPGSGAASLYRISNGQTSLVADLGAFEAAVSPHPAEVDSNPFGLTVLNGGGVLVADAGGNSVLYVDNKGRVEWVATLPTELGSTANIKSLFGCPAGPPDFCNLPAMIPTEAVATDVVIGPDGAAYVSELKGFPAPAGESRVWRIARGTIHAECGTSDACQVIADGFTSIVDLNFGPDGTLYVTELDEASWASVEILQDVTGGTVNACAWGDFPLDCDVVAAGLPMPMSTTVGGDGNLYATIWSLVPGLADVVAVP
ncbi:MAG: ScyD/ScyE family protein [Chloroflexi bacterium]|nr:ScyD/ScyE family protein [Chloroflexota bacterium]